MTSNVNALNLRRVFGREGWLPPEPFGPDGWRMVARAGDASVIASCAELDGTEWLHASIARRDVMPSYADLCLLHQAVFRGYAFQVFAPPAKHVNIHQYALHLWGRLDGATPLPDFGALGSI